MPNKNKPWQCRVSTTLGALEGTQNECWGTVDYTNDTDPTVFMGLYGLPDFYALWRHRGRKAILWCGTDIRHFGNGYWINESGSIHLDPLPLAQWIIENCESYVENEVEYRALLAFGIDAKIVPSFLGDVSKFPVSFKPGNKLYTSVSGNDYETYGWGLIPTLARNNPEIEFHLYGNTEPVLLLGADGLENIVGHGRVPKEQMNEEIKDMQGCLRLTKFDGFSELIGKALLMGQYPVSLIEYPHTLRLDQIGEVLDKDEPNLAGREWVIKNVNRYPWNCKI